MDEHEPRTTNKRARAATASVARTPSPSRRRRCRGRVITGSSPGCVPRTSAATTPSLALRTPPPRRLLPPSGATSSAGRAATGLRPRSARSTPVLRLDDDDHDDDHGDAEADGASTGDDAFSVISGDGSPERDRHVLDFLSLNADGTSAFSLFTPSPATSKALGITRTVKRELVGGAFTPQSSPLRTKNVSPSHFFRSPYARSRSHSTVSSPAFLRLSDSDADVEQETKRESDETESGDAVERELEPEPRRSATRSPRTPLRSANAGAMIKSEPMLDTATGKLPDGGVGSSSSTSSSSSSAAWRRNSLSLMRTPSPAASARAKALRTQAQLQSAGKDPFTLSDDDPSCAPSALSGANDQDWLFSFANTLSPLAPGGANDDDLETSFLTLRFSPAVPSVSIDLQRLLPPFPSPGLGPIDLLRSPDQPVLKTPVAPAAAKSSSASSTPSAAQSSSTCGRSSASSSSSRELNESFPNIRASTSATPGRDERLKVSNSNVMKMKLHVTFDQFPPSHTKREIEAINNSLKRKKQARKRKLEESKQRLTKTNVQRKLLQTPVKEDQPPPLLAAAQATEAESKQRKLTKARPSGRSAQRKLLAMTEDIENESTNGPDPKRSRLDVDVQGSGKEPPAPSAAAAEPAATSLRRRLSPTLGSVSTTPLPPTLTGSATTPNLHPLRLRKSPIAAKSPSLPTTSPAVAKPTPMGQLNVIAKKADVESAKSIPTALPSAVKPVPSASGAVVTLQRVPIATPVKTPIAQRQRMTGVTPLQGSKSSIFANASLLSTPIQQATSTVPAPSLGSSQGGVVVKKKTPCNCKKSKCLKLYCECFASGGYCDESCNCVGCANTPATEAIRQQAIASRLEKNPNAFKPKIESTTFVLGVMTTPGSASALGGAHGFTTPHGHHHHHSHHLSGAGQASGDVKKMHKHGCHCKKSACQKRYCECFQAGVPCGDNCRCIDCKNQSPYVAKNIGVATPLSALTSRGPGGRELTRGSVLLAAAVNQDPNEEQFVSPSLPSIRQRLRIDRETWARNFSSPFEVSPRRERERTERFRTQLKNSRASALLRSFNTSGTATSSTTDVAVKTEPGVAASSSALSVRVNTTPSFASPSDQAGALVPSKPPQSLSPLSDASRPPPAPTPYGKEAVVRHTKRFSVPNPHALEALSIGRKTTSRVYVLPLFGDDLPPVKMEVSAAIFHFLTNADVYNASLVNRLWSRLTMGETVWDHHNFRRMPRHLLAAADVAHHQDDGDVEMQEA